MPNRRARIWNSLVIATLFSVSVEGQQVRPPGTIDMGLNMGATTDKAIGSLRMKIMARQAAGRRVIESGQATTKFKPSPEGARLAVAQMSFTDPGDPPTLPEQLRYVGQQVDRFHKRMAARALEPYDLADGYTMAHALSYEAYHGKPLSEEELKQNRAQLQRAILADANYQGMSDPEKQEVYDKQAALSLYAVECRERGAQAKTPSDRDEWIQKAQRNAKALGLMKFD